VGTLCESFMKKAMKGQEGDWSTLCRKMARRCEDQQGQGEQDKSGIRESDESEGN
jgi:hypothetical protein